MYPYQNLNFMGGYYPQQPMQQQPMAPQQPIQPQYPVMVEELHSYDTKDNFGFTVLKDGETDRKALVVSQETAPVEKKQRKPRAKKSENPNDIIRADGEVENTAAYTYRETTDMLRGTLVQIDELSLQVRRELDGVLANRTLRNKYNYISNLSENLGALLNTKIAAIREINNSITKANDLDYKREKDLKAIAGGETDDKYLMDMYNAFIQNPMGVQAGQNPLGPAPIPATLGGDGIIRANASDPGPLPDAGYLNYLSKLTPEQNMMQYENNPNVKTVVVYDAATNNKFFQVMDMSTMQVIPNVPVRGQMFMEDTTIDLANRVAKNTNLNETYPVVVINEGVTGEY